MRKAALLVLLALAGGLSGCFYHDFDLETIDHYSHYGRDHHVDATWYRSDGCDDF